MTIEEFAKLQVAKLDLGPGDVLLVEVPDKWSSDAVEEASRIMGDLVRQMRAKVVFVGPGTKFSVIRPEASGQSSQ